MPTFDLVVIGGGSAGLTAALEGVNTGARVALVGRTGRYGGQCRYTACVRPKALLHTATVLHTMRIHAAAAGLPPVELAWSYQAILQHKDSVIREVGGKDGYGAPGDFYGGGGQSFAGTARFLSPKQLQVGQHELRADRFIIATGSHPYIPDIAGLEHADYVTYETILDREELPPSLLIIGGGPIGVEFAQIFGRLGTAVTVIETSNEILPQADPDAARLLRSVLEAEGITFWLKTDVSAVYRDGHDRIVTLRAGAETLALRAHALLV